MAAILITSRSFKTECKLLIDMVLAWILHFHNSILSTILVPISEEYFYSHDSAVRWILMYHTATVVPWYFICWDTDRNLTVYTTIGNKMEDVLVMVCYINVLYMLSYHMDSCYLVWLHHFNLFSCSISLTQFQMYHSCLNDMIVNINVHWWPIHIPSLNIRWRANKCNQQRSNSKPASNLMIAYVAAASGLNTNWVRKVVLPSA